MLMGLGGETMNEVGNQYLIVVRNSSGDVAKDVRAWAKKCFRAMVCLQR